MTNDTAIIKKIENDTEIDRMVNKYLIYDTDPIPYVEVGKDKTCLPETYSKYEEKIRKFEVRDDDVYVISHPKTGQLEVSFNLQCLY